MARSIWPYYRDSEAIFLRKLIAVLGTIDNLLQITATRHKNIFEFVFVRGHRTTLCDIRSFKSEVFYFESVAGGMPGLGPLSAADATASMLRSFVTEFCEIAVTAEFGSAFRVWNFR